MVDLALAEFRHDLMLGRFFKLGDVLCRVLAVAHFTWLVTPLYRVKRSTLCLMSRSGV